MSDFAYEYFNTELDKLPLSELKKIYEKVKSLIFAKDETASSAFSRPLGGFEEGFYMSPDFDETPECFNW